MPGRASPSARCRCRRPVDSLAAFKGDHGAEVFRACVACHTLTPEDGTRAGPTLSGVFGRRVATAEGYTFSQALKGLDIVWDARTISKLFEIGHPATRPAPRCPSRRSTTRTTARPWCVSSRGRRRRRDQRGDETHNESSRLGRFLPGARRRSGLLIRHFLNRFSKALPHPEVPRSSLEGGAPEPTE